MDYFNKDGMSPARRRDKNQNPVEKNIELDNPTKTKPTPNVVMLSALPLFSFSGFPVRLRTASRTFSLGLPGANWIHEVKHDGYRTMLVVERGDALAYIRNAMIGVTDTPVLSLPH